MRKVRIKGREPSSPPESLDKSRVEVLVESPYPQHWMHLDDPVSTTCLIAGTKAFRHPESSGRIVAMLNEILEALVEGAVRHFEETSGLLCREV